MIYLCLLIVLMVLIFHLVLIADDYLVDLPVVHSEELPFVSVLIAVRNEEDNILSLCQSLNNLSYPHDKLEILIGDDASSDGTYAALEKYKGRNTHVLKLHEQESGYGKQNALETLQMEAVGDVIIYTDADMSFGHDWIQAMTILDTDQITLRQGITEVSGRSLLARMQNAEWLYNQSGICWATSRIGPVTVWGNNMSMTKLAVDTIQQNEKSEASVVEDVSMMAAVRSSIGSVEVQFSHKAVCSTRPCPDLGSLLRQRTRWVNGFKFTTIPIALAIVVRLAFLPAVIVLCSSNIWYLSFVPLFGILQYLTARRLSKKIRYKLNFWPFLFLEVYEFLLYFSALVYWILPLPKDWKGRKY